MLEPPFRLPLQVIIMSATIDSQRFSEHFDDAPVIAVSGRTFPVEVMYEGMREGVKPHYAIRGAMDTIMRIEKERGQDPGDVLVFLPGEREISEASEYLKGALKNSTEVLPLYARLSRQDQDKIFNPKGEVVLLLHRHMHEGVLGCSGVPWFAVGFL